MNRKFVAGLIGAVFGLGMALTVEARFRANDEELPPSGEFMLPCLGPGLCAGVNPRIAPKPDPACKKGSGKECPPAPSREPNPKERRASHRDKGRDSDRDIDLRYRYLSRIRDEDRQRYKRIEKIRDLSRDYRRTDNQAKKDKIEKELRPLLEQELKAQQNDAKQRVAHMETRLAELKKVLKQRDEHWNEVVDHNFKKITGQVDYLEFPPPPQGIPEPPPPREPQK